MARGLPIDGVLEELLAAVRGAGAALLHAPPGAGKTTRVPPALASLANSHGQVVVVEPRRVAARAAARRIAAEQGWTLGREVGWWIRFERRFRPDSRVVFATEGVLLRWLQRDPFLAGVGALVFDEFHERALAADLALALARRVRREVRPDLRLVVMSATLELEPLAAFLDGAALVRSAGRLHPVTTELLARPDNRPLAVQVTSAITGALGRTDGDLLAFLPGLAEIRQCEETLAPLAAARDLDIRPLHGDLPIESQDAALRRGPRRRVVLATNVAETSVTVEGVRGVIDGGLVRQLRYDPTTGLDRLETIRVSRASAEQRAGRAGREGPGLCLRLWNAADDLALRPFDLPEVRRVDLAGAVLELAAWGERDPGTFDWFEAPEPARLARAMTTLRDLGALDAHGVTPLGRRMVALPLPPRLARLVLEGERLGVEEGAAQVAALLAERDPFGAEARRDGRAGTRSDLLDRLDVLDPRRHRRIFDAAEQILARLGEESDAQEETKLSVQDKDRGAFGAGGAGGASVGVGASVDSRTKTSSEGKAEAVSGGAFGAGGVGEASVGVGASVDSRTKTSSEGKTEAGSGGAFGAGGVGEASVGVGASVDSKTKTSIEGKTEAVSGGAFGAGGVGAASVGVGASVDSRTETSRAGETEAVSSGGESAPSADASGATGRTASATLRPADLPPLSMEPLPLPLPLNQRSLPLPLPAPAASVSKRLPAATAGGLDEPLLRAIAAAYLDRLCRRREAGSDRAVMVGGRGVRLGRASAVHDSELFVAVALDAGRGGERAEGLVRVASALSLDWLPPGLVREVDELSWDEARSRVVARRVTRFEDLELAARELPLAPGEEAAALLADRAAANLAGALALAEPEVVSLRARLAFLAAARPELGLPVVDDAFLCALLPGLAAGRRSFEELRRAPLAATILATLPWPQREALDREAPERLEVPSGSRVRVDYSDPRRPVLAARIQEMFGLLETPRLAGGRIPVLLHLLAPNGRPQQVTGDLASFWTNTYPRVRRELAGRYPKHDWPDDPLAARPRRRPARR